MKVESGRGMLIASEVVNHPYVAIHGGTQDCDMASIGGRIGPDRKATLLFPHRAGVALEIYVKQCRALGRRN